MTNDERGPNLEIRNGETGPVGVPFELRISVILRPSSFGFGHYPEGLPDASSCKDFSDDLAMDVGETPVGATVAERQFLVINAEQVQHRRMKIISRRGRLGGLPRPLVAFTIGRAAFGPAAGHPADKRAAVMVAALTPLREGHAA